MSPHAAPAPAPASPAAGRALTSALYLGRVAHARRLPPEHAFQLSAAFLLLDLDEQAEVQARVPLLGIGRARPLEVRPRDHFRDLPDGRTGTLRERLDATLVGAGAPPAPGRVLLLSQPRVLGHGFNPVSFWWCLDRDGGLATAVAEVHNTFGQRHAYVLPAADAEVHGEARVWEVKKAMHVSPFFDLEGCYRFALSPPGPRLAVEAQLVRAGAVRIQSRLEAERVPLTPAGLGRVLLRHPVMPWKAWTLIHAQALRLWRKGAPFHPCPPYDPDTVLRLPR